MRRTRLTAILIGVLFATAANAQAQAEAKKMDAACRHAMAGNRGAAVVLSVKSGAIIGASGRESLARRLASPGSTLKPFVLQLALERRVISAESSLMCRRHLTIDGRRMDCFHPDTGGSYTATEALAVSCNSYFAEVASRLRDGDLENRFEEIGLTSATGLIAGEVNGRLAHAHDMAQRQLLALGAAGIEVTPLELANAYLGIARRVKGATGAAEVVQQGLRDSVRYGLGRAAAPENITLAGKTGTASDADDSRTHAWFAGYAPAENPEIVVVVFLERGRGSVDAAAVAKRIFDSYAGSKR